MELRRAQELGRVLGVVKDEGAAAASPHPVRHRRVHGKEAHVVPDA
jgi:hypothetical protein